MDVRLSGILESSLNANDGLTPQALINYFTEWKQSPATEDYYFGKDAFNRGSSVLRHVHLPPKSSSDGIAVWQTCWRRQRNRTSDRHLFYVDRGLGRYLLIFIFDDPGAHEFLANPTNEQKALLTELERIANDFYYFGKAS
jgi:Toxin YafO, type II toxin-antitoxin system